MPRSKPKQSRNKGGQPKNNGVTIAKNIVENKSYTIEHSSTFGRYLAAGKNFKPGDIVLEEEPLVVIPSENSSPVCIGCYDPLNFQESVRCDRCGFPLCSANCSGIGKIHGHSLQECRLLSTTDVRDMSLTVLQSCLDAIGALRCLALRSLASNEWTTLRSMETHTEQRRKKTKLWSENQKNVVDVIRLQWGLTDIDEELIHDICGIIEVNSFELSNKLRAIYPTAYLFAHNCIPNTRHCDGENFKVSFRTTTSVQKCEPLYVTYTYLLQGTQKRREHLRETKFFDCACSRCQDPSELGTNMSALKCNKCIDGLVLCKNPLDATTEWICSSTQCSGDAMSSAAVSSWTDKIFNQLDSIDGNDIAAYENFLRDSSRTLHDEHYLCLSALHCLFQLYGKIDGYIINNLTDEQLDRKVEICRILLNVFNKLDPGFSKQRGIIQYELHAPIMVLMQRGYNAKKVGKIELKSKLKEVVKYLEEAKRLLEVEPQGSEASQMASAASEALENLMAWRILINKM